MGEEVPVRAARGSHNNRSMGLSDGFYERIGTLLRAFNGYFERHLEALEAEDAKRDRRFMQSGAKGFSKARTRPRCESEM
jgi:hypothetical protein